MEYTLEDAFKILVQRKKEQEKNIEDLINKISNNEVFTIKSSSSLNDMRIRQNKLHDSLRKEIQQVDPEDYPILRTSDLRAEMIIELEAEIHDMEKLLDNQQQKLSDIQEDIAYLRNKKNGLNKMQEVYLDSTETFKNITYKKEFNLVKHLFSEAKNDLHTVVDIIFSDNDDFKNLLATLMKAFTKGGDDVYVDVTPNELTFIYFLMEADIIQYHPNDETKIRMMELL
ncbi:PREDICTED: uncharacterized protein LOC108767886 [Trachymyrmex cornetzi]|uniref:Uncharacterized protein n=1 Tax=Trachymyrmex cornetzi TaxID=471704 RepID=A0A195DG49_9HYME|nr:PREDICTED: uncharacterized protein LOC108767886 [Trachymyrmex cornetzi]XP_018373520.1 PREDICTED: uncharacterized protein LOC108767886 [Trachymyrmex cornetzi]XP_018373521.1 PREDICTED: uncharacterized protein LOC108767886 [Trachymyrmex cornetzi]KYN11817.1 hypothetical protein ALC57_15958 [Trachymyrmex cornetzi]